jgi:hypothetical protein
MGTRKQTVAYFEGHPQDRRFGGVARVSVLLLAGQPVNWPAVSGRFCHLSCGTDGHQLDPVQQNLSGSGLGL